MTTDLEMKSPQAYYWQWLNWVPQLNAELIERISNKLAFSTNPTKAWNSVQTTTNNSDIRPTKETLNILSPEIIEMLINSLTEENVYEITRQIIKSLEGRRMLNRKTLERILEHKPVSANDIQACEQNDPQLNIINYIVDENGSLLLSGVVYRKGTIFLQRDPLETETSYPLISIPQSILVDIIKTTFLNTPSQFDTKVPISKEQEIIITRILYMYKVMLKKSKNSLTKQKK